MKKMLCVPTMLLLAAAVYTAAWSAGTLEEVKKKGVLVVGVNQATPPFGFLDHDKGEIVGIEPDLAAALAKKLDVRMKLLPVSSAERIPAILDGKVDIVAATMSKNPDRARLVDFSLTYFKTAERLLARTGAITVQRRTSMQASTQGSPQTFQMSLVEPLILVLIPLSGIYLAVRQLLSRPMEVSFFLPILLLAFCIYGLYWGLTMPRKLEFRENEITIKYLDWKRTVIVSDIKSYSYDKERAGRRTQYFLGIQLHQGRVIKLRDIKGGPRSLLQALEERTGLKPTIDLSDKPGEPAVDLSFMNTDRRNP